MNRCLLIGGAATVLAISAAHAEIELPSWSGGPGEEKTVLGGGLFPGFGEGAPALADTPAKPGPPGPGEGTGAPPPQLTQPGQPVDAVAVARPEDGVVQPGSLALRLPAPVIGPLPVEIADDLPPITGELKDEYFSLRPVEYLVDPQQLITEQKANDVLRFLEYHAEEAEFDIYLMIFGGGQDLPEGVSLAERHRAWFGDEPAVLVAYFMGKPELTRLEYNGKVRASLPEAVFEKIFQSCVREAQVADSAADQVERLAIELSIRLYWMAKLFERQSAGERIADTHEELSTPAWEPVILEAPEPALAAMAARLAEWPWAWIGGALAVFLTAGGVAFWLWWRDGLGAKPVLFPDRAGLPSRLGGAFSGGSYVGISFDIGGGGNSVSKS
ncbi:MAG: hypothetical protein H7A53_02195 [Akkermansiaceae bacterium]|nr:hypothetical protein [Akkermansiaceae bacterium]